MTTYSKTLFVAVLTVFVWNCSDPKDPTESNFRKTIDTFYAGHPECITVQTNFPFQVQDEKKPTDKNQKLLNWFVAADFVDVEKDVMLTIVKNPSPFQLGWLTAKPKKFKRKGTRYTLNERGEEMLRKKRQLCFGHREVVDIDQISPPHALGGLTLSLATYQYEIVEMPDWAKLPEAGEYSPAIAKAQSSDEKPLEAEQLLQLTEQGWLVTAKKRGFAALFGG